MQGFHGGVPWRGAWERGSLGGVPHWPPFLEGRFTAATAQKKEGSHGGVSCRGLLEGSHGGVPWRGAMEGSHGGVPWRDPMEGSHGGFPWRGPMQGSHAGVPWRGPMEGFLGGVLHWPPFLEGRFTAATAQKNEGSHGGVSWRGLLEGSHGEVPWRGAMEGCLERGVPWGGLPLATIPGGPFYCSHSTKKRGVPWRGLLEGSPGGVLLGLVYSRVLEREPARDPTSQQWSSAAP